MRTLRLEDFTDEMKTLIKDLHPETVQKLVSADVTELLLVQQVTHKLFVEGNEIVVKSRTGTGKTLSFLLPLESMIRENKTGPNKVNGIQAIIVEPTRELAQQVQTQVEKYTNLKSVLIYGGGVSRDSQSKCLSWIIFAF